MGGLRFENRSDSSRHDPFHPGLFFFFFLLHLFLFLSISGHFRRFARPARAPAVASATEPFLYVFRVPRRIKNDHESPESWRSRGCALIGDPKTQKKSQNSALRLLAKSQVVPNGG